MESRDTVQMELARRLLLGEVIARNARKYPEKEAVIYGDTRLTYRGFNARINQLAHALMDLGIKKGEHVAILSFNSNQYLESYYALAKMGAVAVPLNFRLHAEELKYIINNSDSVALIAGAPFVPTARNLQPELPKVREYIAVTPEPVEGMLHYETLIQKYADDEPLVLVEDEDPAFIMYTAGTTGRPKGAALSHKSSIVMWTVVGAEIASEPDVAGLDEFRALVAPPIFHLAAFGTCQGYLMGGATLILTTQVFDPSEILRLIQNEKCSSILLIPAMANFLLQSPDLGKYDTSSLTLWTSGAAILPTQLRKDLMKHFPNVKIFDIFGQTEMCPVVCMLRPSDAMRKEATVGKAIACVDIRVVDDAGNDVPQGSVGEAVYRAPTMMLEYYNNPAATAEAFRDGWFHSGDMVRQDEEGFVYIVGRKQDMIVSGGENIYPAEIEDVLQSHPKILEAAVIGVFDGEWGESVKAIVVPRRGETLTEEEVIEYCKENMASYKKPKSVDFVDALPRSSTMKVLKTVLREKYGSSVRYG
jgi:acyl-CoA synthetase (AMP-forming)/AMP-acid ligase II